MGHRDVVYARIWCVSMVWWLCNPPPIYCVFTNVVSCATWRNVVSPRQRVALPRRPTCLSSTLVAPPGFGRAPRPSQVAHYPLATMVPLWQACTAMRVTAMGMWAQTARTSREGRAGRSLGFRRSIRTHYSRLRPRLWPTFPVETFQTCLWRARDQDELARPQVLVQDMGPRLEGTAACYGAPVGRRPAAGPCKLPASPSPSPPPLPPPSLASARDPA